MTSSTATEGTSVRAQINDALDTLSHGLATLNDDEVSDIFGRVHWEVLEGGKTSPSIADDLLLALMSREIALRMYKSAVGHFSDAQGASARAVAASSAKRCFNEVQRKPLY